MRFRKWNLIFFIFGWLYDVQPEKHLMDPFEIINKYYPEGSEAREILIIHSENVARKAMKIADKIGLDDDRIRFIYEATMLHDIGMYLTDAPEIGCHGSYPYICHGYLGHDLLVREGFPEHAKVCERHTGTGISKREIKERHLPIPFRSMKPKSVEEKIITYADKFFSKDKGKLETEKSVRRVREKLSKHGSEKVRKFNKWHARFRVS